MISQAENDLLTRTGPGTSGGEMMRRYWQPAALSEELPVSGAPLPIRLLGEDLVLFRSPIPSPSGGRGKDEGANVGLLGLHCSHRGADLSYGRLEDGGLRCIYHGWLYNINGHCLEQPGEPTGQAGLASEGGQAGPGAGRGNQAAAPLLAVGPADPLLAAGPARFNEKIRHLAYPCVERAGLIFAYMGPGEPPLVPNFEHLQSRDEFRFTTKYFQDCNYLQANEGNIDQTHLSYLHRRLNYRANESQAYISADRAPTLEPEETDFGMRLYSVRKVGDHLNVKISNFVVPNVSVFSGGIGDGYSVHYHVPIDDEHHWKYVFHFRRHEPLDTRTSREFRDGLTPDHYLLQNRANRYRQNREEMKTETFSGMGNWFHAQDVCITEGQGPIQDRTHEHLAYTDRAIALSRKVLHQAIQDVAEGHDPILVIRDPERNQFPHLVARADDVPPDTDWKTYWQPAGNPPLPALPLKRGGDQFRRPTLKARPSQERKIMSDYRPLALNIIFRAAHSTLWELADKSGILGSLGLSIQSLEGADDSRKAEAALFNGQVDFVAGNHVTPYMWVAQGKPIVCLASPGNSVRDRIITREPISSLAELKGKTLRIADSNLLDDGGHIGHSRGNHILDVHRAGFADGEFEWVDSGPSANPNLHRNLIEAVRTGKADAAFRVSRGEADSLKNEGLHTLLLPTLPMVNGTTLTTTYEVLQKKEGLAERLVKALILTIHYARVHPEESQRFLDTKMGRPYPERGGRALSLARYPMRPYPTTEGVSNAYELCWMQHPEAKDLSPFALWDMHYLRQLDLSGFIDELIQEQPENVRQAAPITWEG